MPESLRETNTALAKITAETNDPFVVLISTILSQRTRDEMTEKASHELFVEYPDAKALASAPLMQIRRIIKPVGFYNQKAIKIKEVSKIILDKYRGKVPKEYDDLVNLPQVGPKTANCVLVYGYGIPRIPVDTHVHRISNRLGLARTKTPEETEAVLVKKVPKEHWLDLNGLFISFGKEICKPIKPKCSICNFRRFCRYYRECIKPQEINR